VSRQQDQSPNRPPRVYWLLAALLVAYVAACTEYRDNVWGADAWEHHRVFKALAEDLWHPGNPAYAIETPSARYSPYAVCWAVVCRATGLDPYHALSLAGTVNTALLFLGVPFLLARFGEARCSAAAVWVMISLYGGIPATSNSYALADLPWHMVNFSACSFVWVLILLAVFEGYVRQQWGYASLPVLVALSTVTILDHPMTGTWGQFGLWLFTLAAPASRRPALVATVLAVEVITLVFCLAWPWYSFLTAMTHKIPPLYVPMGIQMLMSTQWCIPAVVLGVYALTLRDREAIRVFLPGGYLSYLAGALVFILPTWVPLVAASSRFPMPGLIYLHLSLGIFAYEAGVFRPGTWPERLRSLLRSSRSAVALAAGEVVLAIAVVYFLVPQVVTVFRAPQLLRPYLAPLAGKENKQLDLLRRFRSLLRDIGRRDVVLSDDDTMWSVPSANGRVVHSLHTELFVPVSEEEARLRAVQSFFDPNTSDHARDEVIRRYNVRWIILNRKKLDKPVFDALLVAPAVVRQDDFLVLMDAGRWVAHREAGQAGDSARAQDNR
jgi:hypothetical protein